VKGRPKAMVIVLVQCFVSKKEVSISPNRGWGITWEMLSKNETRMGRGVVFRLDDQRER